MYSYFRSIIFLIFLNLIFYYFFHFDFDFFLTFLIFSSIGAFIGTILGRSKK